jgi:NitT/TauT family transport system substrate-binding protein
MKKMLFIVLALLVIGGGVFTLQHLQAPRDVVRIGFLPVLSSVPYFAAEEEGLFKREGVSIHSYRFSNANQLTDALLSNQVDVASVVGYPTLLPVYEKAPDAFRVVQSYFEVKGRPVSRILVLKDSPIRSIEELPKHSIGTYTGLTQKVNVQLVLAGALKRPSDVELIQVDESLQIPSLVSKRFDALFAIEPITTIAMKKEGARSISDSPRTKYILDPFPAAATLFSTRFMRERPELAARTFRAFEAASAWITQHPREAALTAAHPQYTQLSPEITGECNLYEMQNLGKEDRAVIQKFATILQEHGILKAPLRVEGVFAKREEFR